MNRVNYISPFFLLTIWPIVLLVKLIPSIPQPASILGYLWQEELSLGLIILLAFSIALFSNANGITLYRFGRRETLLVFLPITLFVIWSGFSIIWAASHRNAVHHTLLWTCYLVFFLSIRRIASNPRLLSISLFISGAVISILGASCVIQYIGSAEITRVFTFRYYKYAEALLTLIPLFLALSLYKNSSRRNLAAFCVALGWTVIMLSRSRTILVSGAITLTIFFSFLFLIHRKSHFKLRAFCVLGLILLVTILSQITFSTDPNSTTLQRLTNSEEFNQKTINVRYMYWGLAFESFKSNPVLGVGADNYISDYRNARESYSSNNPSHVFLETEEDILPERTHNEFLQVLSELGIVGFLLFLWLIVGIFFMFLPVLKGRGDLLSVAAFSGMAGFLISSFASGYSFRITANGLCFFFLLAVGMSRLSEAKKESQVKSLSIPKSYFIAIGLLASALMIGFSAIRGISLMYLAKAHSTSDKKVAEKALNTSIYLDPEDPMIRYYYGSMLYNQGRTLESIGQFKFAIDKGIATSPVYFALATAQIVSEAPDDAQTTFEDALRVYPRSIFLITGYAALLKQIGGDLEGQFERALSIDRVQAKSWMLAHTHGLESLSISSIRNKQLVDPMGLKPESGTLALMNYQLLKKRTEK